MKLQPLPAKVRIEPQFPVEQPVLVDGKTLRISLEWAVIEHFLGDRAADEAAVRAFLDEQRLDIARVVKAHLFAHGFPLSGALTLTLDDFRAHAQETGAATGAVPGTP